MIRNDKEFQMAEEKEVVVEEKNSLNKFFDSKVVKGIEGALLVGLAAFMVSYLGLPADFVTTVILGIAGVLGVDGLATIIAAVTKKKEQRATETN